MTSDEPHNLTLASFERVAKQNAELRERVVALEAALRKIADMGNRDDGMQLSAVSALDMRIIASEALGKRK